MTAKELREKFKKYFVDHGHKFIPSASLIPENDSTVLFTTAGMHPLVPYLLGEKHPEGQRLCNIQRCIRTGDIDEVGDESHLTFFEMIGYWSLGDYWKKEAIELIYDFLTRELKLDPKNFAATCFKGDPEKNIPRDEESAKIWQSLGIPDERICYLGYEDNWWGPAGETGPCGPDSELFVWTGEGEAPYEFDPENKGWMELCNDVFMEYYKTADGKLEPLKQKNVDFGMGFERLLAYLNNESDIYKNELFWPIIEKLEELSGKKYEENKKEFRIIADHLKAGVFIINDGIQPSNKDQGYVVRRLLRKAMAFSYLLFNKKYDNILNIVAGNIIEIYETIPKNHHVEIIKTIQTEEEKFFSILVDGIDNLSMKMDFDKFFDLYQSKGLYPEITLALMEEKGYENIDKKEYLKEFDIRLEKHKDISRTASAGMFKGGLADNSEQTTKYHTTAHLMLVALKQVLGNHVEQKGANINAERLRFDFSHPEKMTDEQIAEVENIVNKQIARNLPVTMQEMSLDEAKSSGAHGTFDDRYGERVKVYTIGDASSGDIFSKEICGGPHVERTGVLGRFRIKKEESSSAGIRRIKAVLE